jgi:PKD repeat protein
VEDETGVKANVSSIIITVKNNPPVARIKEIKGVKTGDEIKLSGADSSDSDGKIITYIWTFGDGSPEVRTNESQVTHEWSKSGSYTVELTVQDNDGGTDQAQYQVRVESQEEDTVTVFTNRVWAIVLIVVIIVVVVVIVILGLIRARENI